MSLCLNWHLVIEFVNEWVAKSDFFCLCLQISPIGNLNKQTRAHYTKILPRPWCWVSCWKAGWENPTYKGHLYQAQWFELVAFSDPKISISYKWSGALPIDLDCTFLSFWIKHRDFWLEWFCSPKSNRGYMKNLRKMFRSSHNFCLLVFGVLVTLVAWFFSPFFSVLPILPRKT